MVPEEQNQQLVELLNLYTELDRKLKYLTTHDNGNVLLKSNLLKINKKLGEEIARCINIMNENLEKERSKTLESKERIHIEIAEVMRARTLKLISHTSDIKELTRARKLEAKSIKEYNAKLGMRTMFGSKQIEFFKKNIPDGRCKKCGVIITGEFAYLKSKITQNFCVGCD